MVLTKTEPFTREEIQQLAERFEVYIKTVIDIEKHICCAGVNLHADGERLLLDQGSVQDQIWGGGVDMETKAIDGNAIINIRPARGNPSDEIQDQQARTRFFDLSRYFFKSLYE